MLSRFVLGTCVAAFAFAGSPARADDQVDCANLANARELAVAACDRLLASPELTDKERATAYENRAGAFAVSNIDQAIADISEAIRLDPTRPGNFYVRGNHWTRKNDYHRAILDYSDAARLNPRHTLALVARGESYEKLGELAKAFADYQTALDINPMDISASMRMSRLNARIPANSPVRRPVNVQDDENACRRGSLTADMAIAACGRLIALGNHSNEQLIALYLNRASAYASRGKVDEAIADYSAAIRLDADADAAYFGRAFHLARRADHRGAIADLSEVIRIKPYYLLAYQRRAFAYEKLGEYANALADFETEQSLNAVDAVAKEGIRRMKQALADAQRG